MGRPRKKPPSDFTLGPCCICEATGPTVRVLVSLNKLSPTPGRGWCCVVCEIPSDGALAVLCDECADRLEREPSPDVASALKFACRGYPGTDGRVPYSELQGEFAHRDIPH